LGVVGLGVFFLMGMGAPMYFRMLLSLHHRYWPVLMFSQSTHVSDNAKG